MGLVYQFLPLGTLTLLSRGRWYLVTAEKKEHCFFAGTTFYLFLIPHWRWLISAWRIPFTFSITVAEKLCQLPILTKTYCTGLPHNRITKMLRPLPFFHFSSSFMSSWSIGVVVLWVEHFLIFIPALQADSNEEHLLSTISNRGSMILSLTLLPSSSTFFLFIRWAETTPSFFWQFAIDRLEDSYYCIHRPKWLMESLQNMNSPPLRHQLWCDIDDPWLSMLHPIRLY